MMKKIIYLATALFLIANCKNKNNPIDTRDEIIMNQIISELDQDSLSLATLESENKINDSSQINLINKLAENKNNEKIIGFRASSKNGFYRSYNDSTNVEFISSRGYKINNNCNFYFGSYETSNSTGNSSHLSSKTKQDTTKICIKCRFGNSDFLYLIMDISKIKPTIYDSIDYNGGMKGFSF